MSNSLTYLGKTYNDDEIISGSFSKKQSLNMAELTVDTAEITLRPYLNLDFLTHEPYPMFTRDRLRFETTEENPFADGFSQNSIVKRYENELQLDTWFLQSVERTGTNIYNLYGISSLGRLTQKTHYGGLYGLDDVHNPTLAGDLIDGICGDIPHSVDPVFTNVHISGWLPVASARDNLQQVLFALNANLRTDENGVLCVETLSSGTSAFIGADSIYSSNALTKYETPVTSLVVLEHSYSAGSETKTLFDGVIVGTSIVTPKGVSATGQLIVFNEPCGSLNSTGGQILEQDANYAVLAAGATVLTGIPYIDNTREITRTVTTAAIENVARIENATLVGVLAAMDVANRLCEYYRCRSVILVDTVDSLDSPARPGDVVTIYDPYGEENVSACIGSSQVILSGTNRAKIEARVGFVPWQSGEFTEEHKILVGNGTWNVPAGVSNVRAVLIGGGESGAAGANGKKGGGNYSTSFSTRENININPEKGGAGGAGGAPGNGGNVYIVDIDVSEISSIAYNCGIGGVGDSAQTNHAGTDTTLTIAGAIISSASGTKREYTDIDGTVYAAAGNYGANGGNGGDAGNTSGDGENGKNGENVGSKQGGLGGNASRYTINDFAGSGLVTKFVLSGMGGSGATNINAGVNAQDYEYSRTSIKDYGITYIDWYYSGTTPSGVNGGNAASKASSVLYGTGGDGGNGGSGSGGRGGIRNSAFAYAGSQYTIHIDLSVGNGGKGGNGGTAAPGCVILTYRKRVA